MELWRWSAKIRIEIGRGFYEGVIETVKDADKEEASVRGGQAQQKKSGTEENTDPSENAEFKISVQGGAGRVLQLHS